MRQLHRAFAYVLQSDEPEVCVFFETDLTCETPAQQLHRLLSLAWGVPIDRVESYNHTTQVELLCECALGPASTGDARLLETGAGGEAPIHYARPEFTLLLVGAKNHERLVRAQQLAAQLREFHRTSVGRKALQVHWHAQKVAA
jgi:hypothetical protein